MRIYWIVLFTTSLLTAIFALPAVALVVIIFTFGLGGFLVAPLPTITVVLWAMLPLVLFWDIRESRWFMVAFVCCILGGLFYGPKLIASHNAATDLREFRDFKAIDHIVSANFGLEIHRRRQPNTSLFYRGIGKDPLISNQICSDICERLLMGGSVSWIRLILCLLYTSPSPRDS